MKNVILPPRKFPAIIMVVQTVIDKIMHHLKTIDYEG